MTVYVELVLFNNYAVDMMLIILTLSFLRRKIKWWRVLLTSLVGSIVATVYPICPVYIEVIIKIVLAPILAFMFDSHLQSRKNYKKDCEAVKTNKLEDKLCTASKRAMKKAEFKSALKEYTKRLVVFLLLTYLLGGIDYAINYAIGIDISSYWQFGVTALSVTILCVSVRVLILKSSKLARKVCEANICYGEANVSFKGLCDSGNTLTDSLSGLPVIILSLEAEQKLVLDDKAIEGYIQVKTVAGETSMPIVRLDRVEVKRKSFSAYGALSRKNFDDVEVVLQNTMF